MISTVARADNIWPAVQRADIPLPSRSPWAHTLRRSPLYTSSFMLRERNKSVAKILPVLPVMPGNPGGPSDPNDPGGPGGPWEPRDPGSPVKPSTPPPPPPGCPTIYTVHTSQMISSVQQSQSLGSEPKCRRIPRTWLCPSLIASDMDEKAITALYHNTICQVGHNTICTNAHNMQKLWGGGYRY